VSGAPLERSSAPGRARPGAGQTKLRTVALSKHYGPVVALDGADLEVTEGEFVTLLGPSGSGKTTLLMMVAGLVWPTSGEVWIDDRLSTYLPPHVRDIGMVFQSYALFPHLTVFDNVAFPLRMRRMSETAVATQVSKILDLVRLPDTARRFPRELSGGQQQRIALARCLVYGPSIVLMDEPLGALDKKLRDQMQLEIKAIQRRLGITVLYVTHDQEEAMTLSDRICLMNRARIEQVDTPQDLYFRPRTLFAADFLGDSNILACRLASGVLEAPGGVTVRGITPNGAHGPVTAVVRPESIRVMGPGEAETGEAAGRVESAVFVGGFVRIFVRLSDGNLLQLRRESQGATRLPELGAEVRLGWPAAATILLPPEERAA
jgi:putative spermidine/putrescine transport system ATP-binding protein